MIAGIRDADQIPSWFGYPVSITYVNLRDRGDASCVFGGCRQPGSTQAGSTQASIPQADRRAPSSLTLPPVLSAGPDTQEANDPTTLLEPPAIIPPVYNVPVESPPPLTNASSDTVLQDREELATDERTLLERIGASLTQPSPPLRPAETTVPELPAGRRATAFAEDLLAALLFARPTSLKEDIQIVHPDSGRFDIVLQQSDTPAELPSGSQLKTAPIYTVYLNVGTCKPWALHYCSTKPMVYISEHVVRILASEPMTPPYPSITVVPPDRGWAESESQIALQGKLDSTGRLQQVSPLSIEDQPACARLLPFLQKWVFRPARQGSVPVAIDVVLVIPPSGVNWRADASAF